MARSYWLDLFTGITWEEFLAAGGTVSGFRETQWTTAKKCQMPRRPQSRTSRAWQPGTSVDPFVSNCVGGLTSANRGATRNIGFAGSFGGEGQN
jgi:hypothetical protein